MLLRIVQCSGSGGRRLFIFYKEHAERDKTGDDVCYMIQGCQQQSSNQDTKVGATNR